MNLLLIYILGACISGFVFTLLTSIGSFYRFMCNSIDEAKEEIKNSNEYSLQDMAIINNISNGDIITFLNILLTILSWAGLFLIFIYILSWILDIISKN